MTKQSTNGAKLPPHREDFMPKDADPALHASRRDILEAGAFAAAVAALGAGAAAARTPRRPNILYILADDLGFADLGHRGSDIATPNIDRLAAGGVRLRQFYTQPLCTPTRAALMTGRYPMRYGLQTGVIPSGASYGLDPAEQTLPGLLKSVGYRTSLVGKWHLGHADRKFWPRQRGFDSFYGALIGEIDHFAHSSHGVKDWFRDNQPVDEKGYDTELFGAEAIRQIGAHDRKVPLFLYLAFTAPHTPLQAPKAWLDRYPHIADPNRRAYAAMVSAMDHQVGLVLDALKARGMLEDTLILFHSDNGGTRDKMFVGEGEVGGDLPASNGALREGKGTVYEGGVRVDAILSWAGRLSPRDVDGPFHVVDMLPTLAGLAGATPAPAGPLDGVDFWPAVAGARPAARTDLVLNIDPTTGSVREGDWKLVWTSTLPQRVELFDLKTDPSEKTNLAERYPDRVRKLQDRVIALAGQMVPPHFAMNALQAALSQPPNFPADLGLSAAGRH
jgi:arylsulfatase A-like enzyme